MCMCIFILSVSASTFMFVYVCPCLCARVHLQQAANSPPCQNCFSCGQSSVSVNQESTLGPVLSHNYVPLCYTPLDYSSSKTGPKHLTPVSSCTDYVVKCCKYGPTYIKYSVNLHHLNMSVVLLSLLCVTILLVI